MIQTYIKPKFVSKFVDRDSYSEFYISVFAPAIGSIREQTRALYEEALLFVKERGVQVIQEKVHGDAEALDQFCEERELLLEEAGMDRSFPFTYVEGRPLNGQKLVSLQLWGIVSKSEPVTVERHYQSEVSALVFKTADFELLYCPQVHGLDKNRDASDCNVTVQCERMFERCSSALGDFGMDFKNVGRTWIYSKRLLDWYGEFNRIRTEHFRKSGLFSTGSDPVYPASTGIQGRFADEECFLDLLAVRRRNEEAFEISPVVTTSRQHQAFGYGSAFSRGMVLAHEGYRTVYVSGTASINTAGESTYLGNAEMQTLDTLMNIAAILEDQGGSLGDVVSGVVYCKNKATYETYLRVLRMLRIPEIPLVCVEADVCRHELLIEIELVAVVKDGSASPRW